VRFVWDPDKEAANIAKHGIDFATAAQAFDDPDAVELFDESHSGDGEERWTTIGMAGGLLLLVRVTWTDRDGDDIIRIITARRADRRDRTMYNEG
jgi:uncharacterized DUF497 family protein